MHMIKYNSITDEELFEHLKLNSHEAYTEIYNRYKVPLYRHALKILEDKEDVNDVVHELFLNLWVKRADLHINVSLSAYLYGSIRNRILDHIARNKFVHNYLDSLQHYIERAVPCTERQVLFNELTTLLDKEVAALPPKMREVFELSRRSDLSHKEIAEQLEISDLTVKKQINNALKILRPKIISLLAVVPFL